MVATRSTNVLVMVEWPKHPAAIRCPTHMNKVYAASFEAFALDMTRMDCSSTNRLSRCEDPAQELRIDL